MIISHRNSDIGRAGSPTAQPGTAHKRDVPSVPELSQTVPPRPGAQTPNHQTAAANQLKQTLADNTQKSLHFRVHKPSGQLVVEVKNLESGEVIRTVPAEEILDSLGNIKMAVGRLIDTEV